MYKGRRKPLLGNNAGVTSASYGKLEGWNTLCTEQLVATVAYLRGQQREATTRRPQPNGMEGDRDPNGSC